MLKISSNMPIVPHKITECFIGDEVAIIEVKGKVKKLKSGTILVKFYKCTDGYLLSYDKKKVSLNKDMSI